MKFKIENSVPVPSPIRRGRPLKYPWDEMAVGDSIVVPSRAAFISGYLYGKRHGKSYTSRTHGRGVRVWRTA